MRGSEIPRGLHLVGQRRLQPCGGDLEQLHRQVGELAACANHDLAIRRTNDAEDRPQRCLFCRPNGPGESCGEQRREPQDSPCAHAIKLA